METVALMTFNHTTSRGPISKQYPQKTTEQPGASLSPVFSSFQPKDSKRKELRVSLALFQKNYLPDGCVNETVATVEELHDLWNTGAMDEVPPFLMNCSCIQL